MGRPSRALDLVGVQRQYVTVVASRRCSILVLGAATETGARLELRTVPLAPREPESLRIEFNVTDGMRITLTEGDSEPRAVHAWSMVCATSYHEERDVMSDVVEWTRARIAPRTRRGRENGSVATYAALHELQEVISDVATAALDRCDQDALSVALTLEPRLRLAVYARLIADGSGRLAELMKSCPGALIFALALLEHDPSLGTGAAGERLLADVIAGRKLNPALDDAIDAWLSAAPVAATSWRAPKRRQRVRAIGQADRTRMALASSSPLHAWPARLAAESRASLRAKQRLLIRRASAEVSTRSLWLPPPLVLVPEDIPRDERDNARWFHHMKSHAFTLRRHPDIDRRWQDAVCRFLSRHAHALARSTELTRPLPVSAVLTYAHAQGRWLDRDSDPERVRAEWTRWYRATQQRDELTLLAARLEHRGFAQTHALPAPLFDPRLACTSDLQLAPIASVAELFAEAREMEHCVAHHVFAALAGKAIVFHGVVHGERVTVELVRAGSQTHPSWRVGDVRCALNHPPSIAATTAIRLWAAKVIAWQDMAEIVAHAQLPQTAPSDECPF